MSLHTHKQKQIICPYCGTYKDDPWKYADGEHQAYCDNCCKPFSLSVSIHYSTKQRKDDDQ